MHSQTVLSVCIPSYNRPRWLRRALESVVEQAGIESEEVEIIVSDDSSTDECGKVAKSILQSYRGRSRYMHNVPALGMAANWNNAIRLSTGRFVQVLHDDDYWMDGTLGTVLSVLRDDAKVGAVNLFGVHVVDEESRTIRQQAFRKYKNLPPKVALCRIMQDSAFVRFPGMVVRRDVYNKLGYFDESIGYSTDIDMWSRIVSSYGLACQPCTIAYFTVHSGSLTMEMFKRDEIEQLKAIFDRVKQYGLLSTQELESLQADFFHKFVLGGTYRYIRWCDLTKAKRTMALFKHEYLRELPLSLKWLPLRVAFTLFLLPVGNNSQD